MCMKHRVSEATECSKCNGWDIESKLICEGNIGLPNLLERGIKCGEHQPVQGHATANRGCSARSKDASCACLLHDNEPRGHRGLLSMACGVSSPWGLQSEQHGCLAPKVQGRPRQHLTTQLPPHRPHTFLATSNEHSFSSAAAWNGQPGPRPSTALSSRTLFELKTFNHQIFIDVLCSLT